MAEPGDLFIDMEERIRRYWRRWGLRGPLVVLAAVVILVALLTSFYTVQPEGRAVVKRFGKVVGINPPGLHFKMPFGIDRVHFVPTERQLTEEFGFRTVSTQGRTQYEKRPTHQAESLMLTGDLKVIDVEWVVQYRVDDPDKYLHHVREPTKAIRDVSEAVMRRIVGNKLGSDVLTEKRVEVATAARDEIAEILESFDMGVIVRRIELQDVTPPKTVKPAFNEVNQAEQERERLINEAEKRRNQTMPRAEGQALQIVAEAEGYATERKNRAR
ncbi:MAG: FtsH protease activity modulator HflK, partial [Planctomycetota bacterium]